MIDRNQWWNKSLVAFVIAVYCFLYTPLMVLTLFSFNKDPLPAEWSGVTLKWYYELWQSSYLWEAFATSLIVALSATALSLVMGIMLLYAFMQAGKMSKVMTLFYANLVIPEIVLAVGLLALFAYLQLELTIVTLVIAHTVLGLGYVLPILYQKCRSIEPHIIEASFDLGASHKQTFFRIILPLMKPSFYAAGLLVFIMSFDDFVLSYFCSGSSAQTLSLYIASMMRTGISPVVNALSTVLLGVSSLLVLAFCYFNERSQIL